MYVVSTGDVIGEFYFRKEDGNKHQLSNCLHIFSPVCVSRPHADACKYHENVIIFCVTITISRKALICCDSLFYGPLFVNIG